MIRITDHFALEEFACGGAEHGCPCHGLAALVDPRLPAALEEMRQATGHPMTVTSGVRCDFWNAHDLVGGHPGSFHRVGKASDVTSWIIRKDLEGWAVTFGEILEARLGDEHGNVIFYPKRGFIHVDVGHRIAELVRENGASKKARGW